MKFITSFILLFFLFFASLSFGAPKRLFQDIKLPSQQMIEKQSITNPAAAGLSDVLNANAGVTGAAAATISSFVADPDVPRAIQLSIAGTAADIGTCTATLSGTNFKGASITEDFSITANTAETLQGSKAFKTITSLALPAACEDSPYGATWSLGYSEKLGLSKCMDYAGHVLFSTVAGAYESTRATVTADADEIEKNVADFNGTMNGSNDFEIFFIQNFAKSCL